MEQYSLDVSAKRNVLAASKNRHVNEKHPDRVMQEHDLILITSGKWEIWQEGRRYELKTGDVILLFGGMHHYGIKPCEGEVKTMYVHFSSAKSDKLCDTAIDGEKGFVFPVVTSLLPGAPVFSLMEAMVLNYSQPDIYAPERAGAYLTLVLSELSLLASGSNAHAGKQELIKRLVSMIELNLDRFYSSNELADAVGVSKRSVHNYFCEILKMPPRTYQINRKLESARSDLLTDDKITLKRLAEKYGFCDEYHFSKLYKAKFGVSPKQGK